MKPWFLVLALSLSVTMMAGASQAQTPIGQVKTASGTVAVQRGGTRQPLKIGDSLFQSDSVSTGADGATGITFVDNSMMSLGPDSVLALDRFTFDTTTHAGAFDSSLRKGTMTVKSGQIVQQTPEAMKIRTPAAILGVRGTDFVVRADDK